MELVIIIMNILNGKILVDSDSSSGNKTMFLQYQFCINIKEHIHNKIIEPV